MQVVNPQGLHARPCHSIVAAANGFRSQLVLRNGNREVNGKSILELMTLNAGPGTVLEVCARGGDAATLVERIEELFRTGFGEA